LRKVEGGDVLAGLGRRLGLDRVLQRLLAESRVDERHIS
jgi:phage shock protein PspC (stress-responsive transcriptional regulator)